MKQSTALFKHLTFSKSNIRKLLKSIRHSLQLIDKLHFNPELKNDSWMYVFDLDTNQMEKKFLLEMTEQEKEEIAKNLIEKIEGQWAELDYGNQSEIDERERKKITKTISARRSDLTKEISKNSYTEEQKEVVKTFLEETKKPTKKDIEEKKQNIFNKEIDQDSIEKVNNIFIENTKAKKLLNKIIQLHNSRIDKPVYKQKKFGRTTVCQESIFKLPIHNGVVLEKEDYFNIVQGYFEKYYPNHKMEHAFFHGNERMKGEDGYNNHVHTFLNGRNEKTKIYDLTEQNRKVANIYAKENDLKELKKGLDDLELIGEYRQKLFYTFAQDYLNKHKRNVELKITEDTEARRKARDLIKKDARLPKHKRVYNQLNYQLEKLEKERKELKSKINALEEYNQDFEQEKKEYYKKLKETADKVKEREKSAEATEKYLDSRSVQLESQRKQQENKEQSFEVMESRLYQITDKIIEDLHSSKNFFELFTNLIFSIVELFSKNNNDEEYNKVLNKTKLITKSLREFPDFNEMALISLVSDKKLETGDVDFEKLLEEKSISMIAMKKINKSKRRIEEAREWMDQKKIRGNRIKPD